MTFFTVLVYIVCTRATITKWNYWLYEEPPTGHVLKSVLNQIYFSKWISVLIWQPWLLYTQPSVVGCVVSAAEQQSSGHSISCCFMLPWTKVEGKRSVKRSEKTSVLSRSILNCLLFLLFFFSPACCARPPLLQTNTHVCVLYTKKQKKSSVTALIELISVFVMNLLIILYQIINQLPKCCTVK